MDEIAAGIEMAVAKRCFVMAKKAGATDSITLTGGCAKNDGLKEAIEHVLKLKVVNLKTDPSLWAHSAQQSMHARRVLQRSNSFVDLLPIYSKGA